MPETITSKYKAAALLLAIFTIMLDQFSKWVILEKILYPKQFPIEVSSFFNIALVRNAGVSFGMFSASRQPLVLTFVSVLIIGILLIWLYKNSSGLIAAALGLVIGGAIGNVIDRLRFGAVTDFLDFHIGTYHWPAFNIADSGVFIGVVLLCSSSMFTSTTK